jgi:hypothetical protein
MHFSIDATLRNTVKHAFAFTVQCSTSFSSSLCGTMYVAKKLRAKKNIEERKNIGARARAQTQSATNWRNAGRSATQRQRPFRKVHVAIGRVGFVQRAQAQLLGANESDVNSKFCAQTDARDARTVSLNSVNCTCVDTLAKHMSAL